jgi:hypothetical protein
VFFNVKSIQLFRGEYAMPAKKSSARPQAQPQATETNAVWKWVYVVGLIVAGLVAALSFKALDPYLGWLLLLAGILSGIFFLDSGDIVNFAIRFLLLGAVAKALDAIPAAGPYLSGFFGGVFTFLMPVGLTLLVIYFWKKYFSSMMM